MDCITNNKSMGINCYPDTLVFPRHTPFLWRHVTGFPEKSHFNSHVSEWPLRWNFVCFLLYKKYHKFWNVGMKKWLSFNNYFRWRDYLVVLKRRITYFDLVIIQVTGWWYRQTLVRVAISPPFISMSLFWEGGGSKSFIFFVSELKSIILMYVYVKWRPYVSLIQYRKFERKGYSLQGQTFRVNSYNW